jgi:ribosomal protein S20
MKQERDCYIETLYKIGNYINKKEKKHIDCTDRRLINKLKKYKIKTIIKSTENSIKALKNYEQNINPKYIN